MDSPPETKHFTYAAYLHPLTGKSRIGHLDLHSQQITPLSYASGTPLTSLYEVIEIGCENVVASRESPIDVSEVKLLPPIAGRDVLAVGKNYAEHAKEFNASGYDSSDKSDQPTHPVIFTKRSTSIIAHGDEIYHHHGFTETPDYEGEIGVIVGKPGFRVSEADAMDHVWGFTIINDMTAREKQRDHKQFFLGKSPDTYCPIGPVAVSKNNLPDVLEITTVVNGEKRQHASTKDLIFSIPKLIATISEGQTLQLGDVLATGTPYGVGFGFRPMVFLKPGDEIEISVTGLGTLRNRITHADSQNEETTHRVASQVYAPMANQKTIAHQGLKRIGEKHLFYQHCGLTSPSSPQVIFIHGLGGTHSYFAPLVSRLESTHSLHLMDLEGHGLSPTSATSILSITSLATDILNLVSEINFDSAATTTPTTVIAQSIGCLVALNLASSHPDLFSHIVLMSPPPSPLPKATSQALVNRAILVREQGMLGVVDEILRTQLSSPYHQSPNTLNPLALTALKLSLLGQDPEGYAKCCDAMSGSHNIDLEKITTEKVLILHGADDDLESSSTSSSSQTCEAYRSRMSGSQIIVVPNASSHWLLFEAPVQTADMIVEFIMRDE